MSPTSDIPIFLFHGLLGGILYLFVHWDWSKKCVVQHTVVSTISGYLYWLLHSNYSFPDGFMAVVSGYFSVDFIKQVFSFFGKFTGSDHK